MRILYFVAVLLFFSVDYFFKPNWFRLTHRFFAALFTFFFESVVARFSMSVQFFLFSLVPAFVLSLFLLLLFHLSLLAYLFLLVLILLSFLPFSAFVTDFRIALQASCPSSSSAVSWLSGFSMGPVSSSLTEENHLDSFVINSLLFFEKFVIGPLFFFLLLGPFGLLSYSFCYQIKLFAQKKGLSAPFFYLFFEWFDWLPSRLFILLICCFSHFVRLSQHVSWLSKPSLSSTTDAFLTGFFSFFLSSVGYAPESTPLERALSLSTFLKNIFSFSFFFSFFLLFIVLDTQFHHLF